MISLIHLALALGLGDRSVFDPLASLNANKRVQAHVRLPEDSTCTYLYDL